MRTCSFFNQRKKPPLYLTEEQNMTLLKWDPTACKVEVYVIIPASGPLKMSWTHRSMSPLIRVLSELYGLGAPMRGAYKGKGFVLRFQKYFDHWEHSFKEWKKEVFPSGFPKEKIIFNCRRNDRCSPSLPEFPWFHLENYCHSERSPFTDLVLWLCWWWVLFICWSSKPVFDVVKFALHKIYHFTCPVQWH